MGSNFSNCVPKMALYWSLIRSKISRPTVLWGNRSCGSSFNRALSLRRLSFIYWRLVQFIATNKIHVLTKKLDHRYFEIRYIPVDVMKKKLKKGEIIPKSLNDISVKKWKDKSNVRMTTNAFIPGLVEPVNRDENSEQKPNAIYVYN